MGSQIVRLRPGRASALSRRRLLVTGLTGAGAPALLAACGNKGARQAGGASAGAAGGTPQRGGAYTYYWNANPPALDPQFNATGATVSFACAVMSNLFRFKVGVDPQVGLNHQLENEVAVSAESPDAKTWTIKLRPGVTFHNVAPVNGHALEAEDVKATAVRGVTSPQNPNRAVLDMVDPAKIETPDPHTIVFQLKYPYAPFPNLMASALYALIFPREVLTGGYDPAKQVIGSGPFVFDSYTPDVGVSLKRNPNYFESASGGPYVDAVRHAIIPSAAQQIAQFTGGNMDTVRVVQNDLDSTKKANPNARVDKITTGGWGGVYFQMGDPASPFHDIRLRRAVSMAIDRDALGKAVYQNDYETNFSVKLLMGNWALRMNQLDAGAQQYYKFDLPEAKRLIEQAGASNLNLKLAYPENAFGTDFGAMAQAIYNMLSALPWKLTLVQLDYNKDYLAGGKGVLFGYFPADTMVFGGINTFTDADQYLYNYWYSKSTANREHLSDSNLDALIDKARGIVDVEARRQAYLDAQKYIATQMYQVAGLPAGYNYTLVQPRLQNFQIVPEESNAGKSWGQLWIRR